MQFPLFIIGGILLLLAMVWVIKVLWNWLVPELFKGPRIRYKHALGIVILSRLLLGFGFPSRLPVYYLRQHHPLGQYWHWKDYHNRSGMQHTAPGQNPGNDPGENN